MNRLLCVLFLFAACALFGTGLGCSGKGTEVKPDPEKTSTARPMTGKGLERDEKKD